MLSAFALVLSLGFLFGSADAAKLESMYVPKDVEQGLNSLYDQFTQTPLTPRIEKDAAELDSYGAPQVNPVRNLMRAIRSIPDWRNNTIANRTYLYLERKVEHGNRTGTWCVYGPTKARMAHFNKMPEFAYCGE